MWCQHCQQDVPAIGAAADEPLECARCQKVIDGEYHYDAGTPNARTEPQISWRSEQRMREIGRSLRSPVASVPVASVPVAPVVVDSHALSSHTFSDQVRFDTPGRERPKPSEALPTEPLAASSHANGDRQMQAVAWLAMIFGFGLATGGVVLLGMGLLGQQPEFWQWGVGVTLAGQAALIAGLIRVLISLWSNSRIASKHLTEVQRGLAQVQRSADSIVAQRPGGASGFYGELSRGASPTILLANLKGQIDHLAARM